MRDAYGATGAVGCVCRATACLSCLPAMLHCASHLLPTALVHSSFCLPPPSPTSFPSHPPSATFPTPDLSAFCAAPLRETPQARRNYATSTMDVCNVALFITRAARRTLHPATSYARLLPPPGTGKDLLDAYTFPSRISLYACHQQPSLLIFAVACAKRSSRHSCFCPSLHLLPRHLLAKFTN